MQLRRYIQDYLKSDPQVWDAHYRQVPVERLLADYRAIRHYLLLNHQGARVAIGMRRDYRYFLTVLACMETGVVFVPLRVEWPQARIEQIREISGYEVLLSDALIGEIVEDSNNTSVADVVLPDLQPQQHLYCLFTSGTTGAPKGVLIRRESYANFLRWVDGFFESIGKNDRLLNSTDYTFDVSMAEVAIALTRKAGFFCSNFRDDFFTLLNELHELRISVIATVPNNMSLLLDERWMGRADLSNLRHALIAGSRFPVALDRQFKRFLPEARVYNCYGPTEATIYCLARELNGTEDDYVEGQTVSVGTKIAGCLPLVVDNELRPVALLQRGELLMGGIQVMDAYINNATATEAALVEVNGIRYYRTGDIAFYNDKGDFFITGRNDDTVKISGQRVNLSDVEGYVQKMIFVSNCAAIAVEDIIRGVNLILYIVPTHGISKEAVTAALKDILPKHQIPQDIVIVDTLPVNNSGKICKKTLQQSYRESVIARKS